MVQGKINRGRHTDNLAERHSIRTNQCLPPPSSPYFLQARCPSCRPTHSVKALKATRVTSIEMKNNYCQSSPYSLLFLVFLCLLQFITGPQSSPKEHLDLTAVHCHLIHSHFPRAAGLDGCTQWSLIIKHAYSDVNTRHCTIYLYILNN